MQYAVGYPVFSEAISADSVTLKATAENEERTFKSSNKMKMSSIADYYHPSVTGGKYTATDDAGECAAVITNMDGYSYIVVTLGGKLKDIDRDGVEENSCFTDAKKMLNWVYDNIRYRVIASQDHSVAIVNVKAGKDTDKVRLIPEKETSALVPASVTPASVMFEIIEESVPDKITAPVKAGEILGQAKVYYAGIELTTVNLVAAQNVERSFMGLIMSKISDLVGSTFFMLLTIVLFLAAASYLAIIMSKFYGWDKKLEKILAERNKNAAKKAPAEKKTKPAEKTETAKEEPKKEPVIDDKPVIPKTNVKLYFVSISGDGSISRKQITRTLQKTNSPLTTAINALLEGPVLEELNDDCMTLIPEGSRLLSASVKDKVATLNLV